MPIFLEKSAVISAANNRLAQGKKGGEDIAKLGIGEVR